MSGRLLSLAAGTVPELGPVETVRVAASAGWPATGIWYDHESWTSTTPTAVRAALDDAGIIALDLEPVFVTAGGDHGDAIIDAAAAIGAANVLVVGLGVDDSTLRGRLEELGARARTAGVTCALEFGPLFSTPDLASALDVVTVAGGADNGLAVLVDGLHLARSGDVPASVAAAVDIHGAELFPYAQLCDATAIPTNDLRTDALDDRLLPGYGELPIDALVAALPDEGPLSVELRSAALRRDHEPNERARVVLDATRRSLAR